MERRLPTALVPKRLRVRPRPVRAAARKTPGGRSARPHPVLQQHIPAWTATLAVARAIRGRAMALIAVAAVAAASLLKLRYKFSSTPRTMA
jgi:hypothetical protein